MKKNGFIVIMSLLLLVGVSFAANPSFSLAPVSGSQLKLHCNYNFNIKLYASGKNYNAFDSTIKFNSGQVQLTHQTVNSPFIDNAFGSVVGNLYRSYGALPGGQKSSGDVNATTFGFKTIVNLTSTNLQFSNINGGPVVFGPSTTDDGITINGYDVSSADILTGIYDSNYSFVALPCVVDSNAPAFYNLYPYNGLTKISSGQIFYMLVFDWVGAQNISGPSPLGTNNSIHYWYSGLNNVLSNYRQSPSNVDNQEGVNSGSIKMTVSCPSCKNFGGPYVLSGEELNISTWTGDNFHNRFTWNSKDRGYNTWFLPPSPYEIEKQVFVSMTAVDNPNENNQSHTGNISISFNAPVAPVYTPIYPLNGATFVGFKSQVPLSFNITDDWAGVDTGSIKITIPTMYSGSDLLLTGYTYSGSDLQVSLISGNVGTGNAGGYNVKFNPKRNLPSNTLINVTGTVLDPTGSTGYLNMSFTTRPSCAFWGCSEIFNVNIMNGSYGGIFDFSGSVLVVTGTDSKSPYPYLTGENMDILMCGIPYTGTTINANVDMYDTNNNRINGLFYTGKELYITGMNFVIQDGVIIIQ